MAPVWGALAFWSLVVAQVEADTSASSPTLLEEPTSLLQSSNLRTRQAADAGLAASSSAQHVEPRIAAEIFGSHGLENVRDQAGILADLHRLEAFESEAWDTFVYARKFGPHEAVQQTVVPVRDSVHALLASAASTDWYVLAVALIMLLAVDIFILQHLPETSRTHIVLFVFWLLVAVGFCVEVWYRLGPRAGISWATGYLLEIVFSFDNVFMVYLIFATLETPRRLIAKALFIGVLGSICFRLAFFMGMASFLDKLKVIPYFTGMWLIYCGMKQVTAREDADDVDVTQTTIVVWSKKLLGDRLGEWYDEEGEAVFMRDTKGKLCVTLLGVVVFSLLAADFVFALDVVLTKADKLPNAYLNFSSSALAVFAVRALFFVARDVFGRFSFAKYGVGVVLIFLGAETLMAHFVYVNALLSSVVIVAITAISIGLSMMRSPFANKAIL